ncbi:MAG: ABC transporter ATP-binding protein [Eubacteriales bacterium]|nr:ABC transporter ATP-binding protein [Eubacteriales bacterium]
MRLVEFSHVDKRYGEGESEVRALDDVSFTVEDGEFCVLLGASGAGKTTLLNLLGGMDTVTAGKILFDGREVSSMTPMQLTEYRRKDIGFVFQFYNLIPTLTALENVEIAAMLCEHPIPAKEALDMVGLSDRKGNFPAQLSGGEQQRVAIARALAKNPRMLLCDEPTGALDFVTGKAILKMLYDLGRTRNTTVLMITHNSAIAKMADRVLRIQSGRIVSDQRNEEPVSAEELEW